MFHFYGTVFRAIGEVEGIRRRRCANRIDTVGKDGR